MIEHFASVTIKAPVHQTYTLFTHFEDFPKFMSFIREVTYYDEQRSHWVVQVIRQYEWDAINMDWISDQQIGWHSTSGLCNNGKVKFRAIGPDCTIVDVYIQYIYPVRTLEKIDDIIGASNYFENILQKDLNNFAHMVEQAPSGALDPMSSHYLFHRESAAAKKLVTSRQLEMWQKDPRMSIQALAERKLRIEDEEKKHRQHKLEYEMDKKIREDEERYWKGKQQDLLEREAERREQEEFARQVASHKAREVQLDPHYTYAAWAHSLGDKDGLRARIPNFTQDPMTSRRPVQPQISTPSSPPA